MADTLRGEVLWADLDPTRGGEKRGFRPIVVVSHDLFNQRSGTVIAMAVTSQEPRAGYPLSWKVPAGILPKASWVKTSQVRALATEHLGDRIGRLDDSSLAELVSGLVELIGQRLPSEVVQIRTFKWPRGPT